MKTKKSSKKHKVFVYGTLRRRAGENAPIYLLRNAKMFSAGAFPFIRLEADNQYIPQLIPIRGNLLEVTDEELVELDYYESVPSLYTRETVTITKEDTGEELEAFVYVAGPGWEHPVIKSGDWLQYIGTR